MKCTWTILTALTALFLSATEVMALEGAGGAATPLPGQSPHSLRLLVGAFDGDRNRGQLNDEEAAYAVIGAYEYRVHRNVALGVELGVYGREYDAPAVASSLFDDPDNEMLLETGALVATVRGILPVGIAELYLGAGVGVYFSELIIEGEKLGLDGRFSETDSEIGHQVMLGADIALTPQHHLGVEFRRTYIDGDFGTLSGGDVEIGGKTFALSYRFRF